MTEWKRIGLAGAIASLPLLGADFEKMENRISPPPIDPEVVVDDAPAHEITLAELGKKIHTKKDLTVPGGFSAWDLSGRRLDFQALMKEERLLKNERHGKLDLRLSLELEGAADDSLLPVAIWIDESPFFKLEGSDFRPNAKVPLSKWRMKNEAMKRRKTQFLKNERVKLQNALMQTVPNGMPSSNADDSLRGFDHLPILIGKLSPEQLRGLKYKKGVNSIELLPPGKTEYDLIKTQNALNIGSGFQSYDWFGGGARVGVWHSDHVEGTPCGGPGYRNYLPQLPGNMIIRQSLLDLYGTTCREQNIHLVMMVGTIANRRSISANGTGTAPHVQIFIANHTSNNLGESKNIVARLTSYDWAINNGLRLMNQSWHMTSFGAGTYNGLPIEELWQGSDSFFDRITDYGTMHHNLLMVQAAGNNGQTGLTYVVHKGRNNLVVGFNSSNTTMDPRSSWRNPSNGQELPHIVALTNATQVLEDVAPDVNQMYHSGSSISAAAVTGFVADMHAYDKIILRDWPEASKAIVLASAKPVSDETGAWNDFKAGLGQPNADAARRATYIPWSENYLSYPWALSNAGFHYGTYKYNETGSRWIGIHHKGGPIRFVSAWSTQTNSDGSESRFYDFDLVVIRAGTNVRVGGSYHWANSFESIRFTNLEEGYYWIGFYPYTHNRITNTPYSLAWVND